MSIADYISLDVHGGILELVLAGTHVTRGSIIAETGLARGTVTSRIDSLLEAGLLYEAAEARRTSGGRPARMLGINPDFGHVLTVDIGQTWIRVAVTDLKPTILAEDVLAGDVHEARSRTLTRIADALERCLARLNSDRPVLGIGISMPAPVDAGRGDEAAVWVTPGWDDFDVAAWFETRLGAPAFVENDVNLLALVEHRIFWPSAKQFLFIKAGTAIGSGIIHSGRLYRGAQGSSGHIGHVRIRGASPTPCRCGKTGCLEAQAGGWGMARELRAAGFDAQDARDVLALVDAGVPQAVKLVERAGVLLGEVVADLVSILNPEVIVIGGTLSCAGPQILSGITETVQRRCLPIATRALKIVASQGDHRHGVLGAAHLVIESRICAKRGGTLPLRRKRRALSGVQAAIA